MGLTRRVAGGPELAKPLVELAISKPWRTGRQQAITLPMPWGAVVVLYFVGRGDEPLVDLRVHEIEGHARGFATLPWWRALGGYVWRWARAGFSYQDHPDEIAARALQAAAQRGELPLWASRG